MEIFKQIAPLRASLDKLKRSGKTIGLVPTMGALHNGHISLVEASKTWNQVTVATIFVNPTQFNNAADLQKYPRTLDHDLMMLETAKCDVLFYPNLEEIYPEPSILKMDFGHLDKVMEGEFRPGHFSGVALIVSKLFNIVQPDTAYFGQKDWQQFAVISRLVAELGFNLTLTSVPILREPDGLAMSSRNLRLDPELRPKSTVFYESLSLAKAALREGKSMSAVKKAVSQFIEKVPGMRLEYIELADRKNLTLLENVDRSIPSIICIAGYAGEIRLIDNLFLD